MADRPPNLDDYTAALLCLREREIHEAAHAVMSDPAKDDLPETRGAAFRTELDFAALRQRIAMPLRGKWRRRIVNRILHERGYNW